MKALVTGASSGIGRELALRLDRLGYDVIITARREDRLIALSRELKNKTEIITKDLSVKDDCISLYHEAGDIDILVNNAGFGVFGAFSETDLDAELRLIDTNIRALHILTKLYYNDFRKKNSGYILNIASSAAFFPGPLFSSYYASKAYVLRLTSALYEELKKEKSNVGITAFCPGPVSTEFNSVAGVSFGLAPITAEKAAKTALSGMFKKKRIVTPNFTAGCARFLSKIAPDALSLPAVLHIQRSKSE